MEEDGDAPALIITGNAAQRAHARARGLTSAHGKHDIRDMITSGRIKLAIWTQYSLQDPLLSDALRSGLPCALIDVDDRLGLPDRGWWPSGLRRKLEHFSAILACNQRTKHRLIRLGAPSNIIHILGALNDIAPCSPKPDQVAELIEEIGTRPLWLALCADAEDLTYIAAAHKQVSLHAHRLLLVLHLDRDALREDAKKALAKMGLSVADWDDGDALQDSHHALITSEATMLPEWTHLATASFLGGSLGTGAKMSPNLCAQMGSVVIHGPEMGVHSSAIRRLDEHNATSVIHSASGLGIALERLLAPDFAAQKALSGWDALTETAEASNMLADLIRDPSARPHA